MALRRFIPRARLPPVFVAPFCFWQTFRNRTTIHVKLSPEEKREIWSRLDAGETPSKVARALNLNRETIKKYAAFSTAEERAAEIDRLLKPMDNKERLDICRMYESGKTVHEVAKHFNRSLVAIQSIVAMGSSHFETRSADVISTRLTMKERLEICLKAQRDPDRPAAAKLIAKEYDVSIETVMTVLSDGAEVYQRLVDSGHAETKRLPQPPADICISICEKHRADPERNTYMAIAKKLEVPQSVVKAILYNGADYYRRVEEDERRGKKAEGDRAKEMRRKVREERRRKQRPALQATQSQLTPDAAKKAFVDEATKMLAGGAMRPLAEAERAEAVRLVANKLGVTEVQVRDALGF